MVYTSAFTGQNVPGKKTYGAGHGSVSNVCVTWQVNHISRDLHK